MPEQLLFVHQSAFGKAMFDRRQFFRHERYQEAESILQLISSAESEIFREIRSATTRAYVGVHMLRIFLRNLSHFPIVRRSHRTTARLSSHLLTGARSRYIN